MGIDLSPEGQLAAYREWCAEMLEAFEAEDQRKEPGRRRKVKKTKPETETETKKDKP